MSIEPGNREPTRPRRRAPQWSMIFLTGVFAATVYAATESLLRLAVDAAAPAGASSPAPESEAASVPAERSTAAEPVTAEAGSSPAAAPVPASAPAAVPAAQADSNVEEPAEGPRRAAPPKLSDDEAPEFRESADNNISLPVDI
ncbi:MAG: hypothetical protein H7A16_07155 [Sinobacteraceae bacterium]|nr:hypothetical protein [Nevskiaceae bacterium]